jgi:hypothetical protein
VLGNDVQNASAPVIGQHLAFLDGAISSAFWKRKTAR